MSKHPENSNEDRTAGTPDCCGIPQEVWDSYQRKVERGYPLHLTAEELELHQMVKAYMFGVGQPSGFHGPAIVNSYHHQGCMIFETTPDGIRVFRERQLKLEHKPEESGGNR